MDLPVKPELWIPPRPAIIRAASSADVTREAQAAKHRRDAVLQSGTIFINSFVFAVAAVDITQTHSAADGTDLTTYTFNSADLGAAVAGRVVAVGVVGRSGSARTISSVTVAGSSAAAQATANNTGAGADVAAIYSIVDATNATASIVITWSGAMLRCGIIVWRITGTASAAAYATATDLTLSSFTLSANVNVPANGGAIGCGWFQGVNPTFTWTGLTEELELNVENTNNRGAGASLEYAAAQTPLTISVQDTSGTATGAALAVASWGP